MEAQGRMVTMGHAVLQMVAASSQSAYPMVCNPDPLLLTACYEPVQAFCTQMTFLCGGARSEYVGAHDESGW
jgi:hypothetical protein